MRQRQNVGMALGLAVAIGFAFTFPQIGFMGGFVLGALFTALGGWMAS